MVAEVIPPCEVTLPADHGAGDFTLAVDYAPGDGSLAQFERVSGPELCRENAWWMDGLTMRLCPEACAAIESNASASLSVTGCSAP